VDSLISKYLKKELSYMLTKKEKRKRQKESKKWKSMLNPRPTKEPKVNLKITN
jgi:hypothetical protein